MTCLSEYWKEVMFPEVKGTNFEKKKFVCNGKLHGVTLNGLEIDAAVWERQCNGRCVRVQTCILWLAKIIRLHLCGEKTS